jgi:hypothetical protein
MAPTSFIPLTVDANQLNIYAMAQMDLFAAAVSAPSPVPTEESIRLRFETILVRLRQASEMPLTEREVAFWKVVTPQMSNWLPPVERQAVCAEFNEHLERLKAA